MNVMKKTLPLRSLDLRILFLFTFLIGNSMCMFGLKYANIYIYIYYRSKFTAVPKINEISYYTI